MDKQDLDAIATREAHCKPYGSAVTLSIGERDELVALARDGMRYRWLRIGDNDEKVMRGSDVENTWLLRRFQLDKAIDEAMAKEGTWSTF